MLPLLSDEDLQGAIVDGLVLHFPEVDLQKLERTARDPELRVHEAFNLRFNGAPKEAMNYPDIKTVEIDPNAKFARLGLDSATIINLIIAAEEWLGIELDPDTVYEYPSVNALSDHLAALIDRADGRSAA